MMEVYKGGRLCPKCHYGGIKDKYITGIDMAREGMLGTSYALEAAGAIKRTCLNCEFVWHELPLDAICP